MKKILLLLIASITFSSCEVAKDHAIFSGTITNQNSDSLIIRSIGYIKKITVNEDGTFSDTLKIKGGNFQFYDGKKMSSIHLMNGYDLKLMLDAKEFHKTITFSGRGANANNYLAKKILLQQKVFNDTAFYTLKRDVFDAEIKKSIGEISNVLSSVKDSDSTFIADQKNSIDRLEVYSVRKYEDKQHIATFLARGNPSPKFMDYENYAGGTTSLDDLKGKYVYINVWTTWCVPCKVEMPYLKEVKKAYYGKHIAFVSISVDDQKVYDAWREMIADKELTGIQLYAKGDETFTDAYRIRGIPRFILIDPKGNVVDADAPRPSSKELRTLFDSLEI
ncbi:TlpA family protein disulfide reductase [Maribacter sp. 2304DJ31-5]|uniref:TlpA family protein disulfide reductase n=1 Tax=Maribacter sp. 2304DJ31-5 TaxID=3386273 RepID=UPI0039BD8AFC